VSKNVAVFVDVANIFYAAKAAGADIDYVTLLKSAVAGRDFVRAYAYTGLDPENENQRQFHAFLARSGYKVVSKDIRKYGDGRIKANLDIELVVDLMRTASNLDIAVVVSGDGDFAPAIRAVQQQGVRVEVISFRGNTSSDLIEVADQFIDIAQIARVDKDSGRSGRRVAAEGDLSMTEVPEKETEGAPRRRRGGRTRDVEREDRVIAASAEASSAGLTVMPGERLSRVDATPSSDLAEAEVFVDEEADLGDGAQPGDELSADGRRRRRRRGGRGRGRGRRPEDGVAVGEDGIAVGEDEDDFEAVLPPPPPVHQSFGSVWDSQLGSGQAAASSAGPVVESFLPDEDEEDLEEPEIPEYLLAERRRPQTGGGQRGRMGRGRGAYQAALDRERFGRGAPAPSGFGANAGRMTDRPRQDRGRPGRPMRQDRPRFDRPAQQPRPMMDRPPMQASGDPWSEVPADLEDILRAELARKTTSGPVSRQTAEAPQASASVAQAAPAAARRGRPRTATTESAAATAAPTPAAEPVEAEAAKPKRATRARTTKAAAAAAEAAPVEATAKPARRTRTTKPAEAASEEAAPAKPTRRRTTKAAADPSAE
jgi:uncharacterized LabA/DUF88 family protein